VVLLWGLIDQRLDTAWCKALATALQQHGGTLILAGPQQSPDAALAQLPNTRFPGPVAYDDLPGLAAEADVLVMPYIDAPVTRAMQPLKFKEYLATGKPVVARDLPATSVWRDAADLTGDAQAFVELVLARAKSGVTPGQTQARKRLKRESWSRKAKQLASVWNKQPIAEMRAAA
jgi:glycosyltransferase involved in cell wall biosynthesis